MTGRKEPFAERIKTLRSTVEEYIIKYKKEHPDSTDLTYKELTDYGGKELEMKLTELLEIPREEFEKNSSLALYMESVSLFIMEHHREPLGAKECYGSLMMWFGNKIAQWYPSAVKHVFSEW